jgi:hypothetical protein
MYFNPHSNTFSVPGDLNQAQFNPTDESSSQISLSKMMANGCAQCCIMPIGLALFIIGCCAAAGAMSGIVAGGCAVGLSIPLLLTTLCMGRKDALGHDRTLQLVASIISNLAYILIGALCIAGIVPATTVGYTVLAISMVDIIIGCVKLYCCGGFEQVMSVINQEVRTNEQNQV